MDTYCGLVGKSEVELIYHDNTNYDLYCVMNELFRRREAFSIDKICEIKKNLSV